MKDIKGILEGVTGDPDDLELFQYLLEEEEVSGPETGTIPRREDRSRAPLSSPQQRLWFLDQMEPGSPRYNVPGAMRLNGKLDPLALERSINEIIKRHESLRTTFTILDQEPIQVIHAELRLPLPMIDLSELPGAVRETEAERIAVEEAQQRFDLSAGPLIVAKLLRFHEDSHALLLTMHHIISDGWSVGLFITELASLYDSFTSGSQSRLSEPVIQYGDYSVWQKQMMRSEVMREQLDYWVKQLSGELAVLEMPTDKQRPTVQGYRGCSVRREIGRDEVEGVRRVSRQEGATMYMVVLGVYAAMLMRMSRQEEVVVGVPVANRSRVEVEGMIGLMVNSVALRIRGGRGKSVREMMREVREVAVGGYSHGEVPIEKVVEEVKADRDLSHTPLFQTMFALQDNWMQPVELNGLMMIPYEVSSRTSKFDLALEMRESENGLTAVLEYSTELYEEATAERLLQHYETLLKAAIANPDSHIMSLPLLTPSQINQITLEWNDTRSDYPEVCIHELVQRCAETKAEAVALECGGEQVSYGEMNRRANQLCRYLMKEGVVVEQRVGVCMERSVEMVLGQLAVMKAGGAYVPLDATYPKERLSYMISDSSVSLVVTEQRFAELFRGLGVKPICLDTEWESIAAESALNPVMNVSPENLAYIIYTSGSTGRPKGVLVTHAGVVNCLVWLRENFCLDETDRVIFKATLSFDASVWELFLPLIFGATVIIARPGGQQDAAYLIELISESRATTVHFIPSMFSIFLEQEGLERLDSLKQICCGGEALSIENLHRAFDRLKADLHNFYGPTEASIGCINWRCEPEGVRWTVPIGRPINNTQVYILDGEMEPVPVGVIGELYIAGEGLARGYLNRADLTAERFIADPYSRDVGARMYRSGDLARYVSDGRIEYLGRADEQVKVRGFRVELGEVEAALVAHTAVRESLALVREVTPGDRRLVAYVVADEGQNVSGKELRAYLKERLPDYMVPSSFVMLERMPLSLTGKVDRQALLALDCARQETEEGYRAPRTPVEEIVAAIWSGVLGIERIGVDENFFDLGGHSLLATRVASRISATLQSGTQVRDLFERPTIAELAKSIQARMTAGHGLKTPPLVPSVRGERVPLSFAQQRLWFLDQLEVEKAVYNMAAAERLIGRLCVATLAQSLGEVIRRHETLRTTFAIHGGEPVQLVHGVEPVTLPVVDLSELEEGEREAEAERLAALESRRSFDLERGPLMRVTLLRLGEDCHVLLVVMHHIVTDGWSVGVLTGEIAALYDAFTRGEPSPLAELPIQYADFAVWQREWLKGDVLETQLQYWKRQLGGDLPALELPTDRPRPPVQSFRGATLHFSLCPQLSADLYALSRREGVTLFMTLLAGFQALLARHAAQTDVSVGTPIANRNHPELERLIGFFANTLVLRANLAGNPTFRELIARAREVALGAYAHQDLPFEMLVEQLQPERDLSHSPLFQAMFALQNAPQDELKLAGVELRRMDVHTGLAHFDLTLSMAEDAGEMVGTFEYNTDLFDAETVQRMVNRFEVLLAHAASYPGRRLSELPILTESERHKVLVEWNNASHDYRDQSCIHVMFERQVEEGAEQVAVECEGRSLSYAELNARSNRLANYLRRRGVGAESLIGISLDRGEEVVVGLMGILKAGGAYVPLDPTYPKQRLAFMLEGTHIVLTERRLLGAFPEGEDIRICLDEISDDLAKESCENPPNLSAAENLAYVIYTSGSTGRPKGVAMTHGAISNMICWQIESSKAAAGTRTLQFASLSFDVSFQEIISTLCSGGTIMLVAEDVRRDDERLMRFMIEANIERLFVPFVMLQQLAERAEGEKVLPRSLREVMTAGEQLKITPQIESLFANLPECALYNHYGPTETHAATWLALDGRPGEWPLLPPIGRPLPHARTYILDGEMEPVPVGVIGELYIAGEGLARGYLNRADLTAERFIADPYSRDVGARMYRSGDLARYVSDGRIEYLGRADEQVKVRGFRVELGEVEAALRMHPKVREAVATAWEGQPGQKRIAAYVVTNDGSTISGSELRDRLRETLPDYMIPSAFITLDELPLTRSGKVDRLALPSPDSVELESGRDYIPPRNYLEEILAVIWSDVLGIERVSRHDNFFDLGGHSLVAARLVSRVREAVKVELPLRKLFERPTVAGLAEIIEAELKAGAHLEAPPIVPVSKEAGLPLSFAQERMWFLSQLIPNSAAYNMPAALRVTGQLDKEALESSINKIIERHESLRTTFELVEGRPLQFVHPAGAINLPVIDLQQIPDIYREAEAKRIAVEEAQQRFDLSAGPLIVAKLLRFHEDSHALLLTMHHIISDGWSVGLFITELASLYDSFTSGSQSRLSEPVIQYGDYSVWQKQMMRSEVMREQLDYWVKQLSGELAVLEMPTDKQRPMVQGYRGCSVRQEIGRDEVEGVRRVSRQEGATMYMVVLGVYAAMLMRMSRQEEVVVGVPVANRSRVEVEGMIGLMVNSVALRIRGGRGKSVREMMREVREVAVGGYSHGEVPIEKVVEEVKADRDLSHTPLFQTMFALQNAPMPPIQLTGLILEPMQIDSGTAKFDLTFSIEETERGLLVEAQYSTELYEEATAERLLQHYETLLKAAIANPDSHIMSLPLLTPSQINQITLEWNDTRSDYPEVCIHELVQRCAETKAEAVALECGGEQVSYGEMNRRANQLCRYLMKEGVVVEQRVGVCMERSVEMVLGQLAVMKAGGAYVPLDATYPKERLSYMISDSSVSLLLTQRRLLGLLPEHGVKIICLDDWEAFARESDENIDSGVKANNLAYALYTSGSTGRPKGVEVQHSSLVNLVSWHNSVYGVTPADRASQVAGPSFDASVWETWPYLAAGASLHIPDEETRAHPSKLARWIAHKDLTICFLPTPVVEMILDEPCLKGAALRLMVTGGDKLNRVSREDHGFVLVNHYGPSENTVVVTCAPAVASTERRGAPTIGRPIANVQAYLLDEYLNPVPVGVTGELYAAGSSLARGYLNRPDVTAEKFIPNPFSDSPGARMYRTGDLARYLADGDIEFIGRSDYQVKIRGFRIELGEIEFLLNAHPAVSEAVVVARETAPGDKRLVAYVVSKTDSTVSAGQLRGMLKERLPNYMVPSAFVMLDSLPLTRNGKIDRDRLPPPDGSRADSEEGFVAPTGRLERAIASIWQDALRVERVGRHDNFFDLGGHSLLMVEVHTRLQSVIDRDLSIIDLFKFPTVSSLAQHLRRGDGEQPAARANQERGVSRRQSIAQRARHRGRMRAPEKD